MRNHLSAKISNLLSFQGHVDDRVWTIGEINDSAGKGFVEWCVCVAETGETRRGPECGLERLTKRDKCVFGRMVIVDCNVGRVSRLPFNFNRVRLFGVKTYCAGRLGIVTSGTNRRALLRHEAYDPGNRCQNQYLCAVISRTVMHAFLRRRSAVVLLQILADRHRG